MNMFYLIRSPGGVKEKYVGIGDSVLSLNADGDAVSLAPDRTRDAISWKANGTLEYLQIMDNGQDRVFKTYRINNTQS